ncbi:DNA polymerase III subunits gamma and tau [hydrothermal vent metagenome]|uniref:DNA-directed DNA polymerase n=1 Tax=hydrothermal vent metagenome TaxID=652676 RepID=A0A3B0WQU5_9ZZZZ
MSYQVLARKWRPGNFTEMVGQAHILRALINALDEDRLHHAYLFTGTRGVGKTTIARIFAKSLNCETGITSTPCGECGACLEIAQGRFIDLIEVDAASRTKVEDTRELLDNVQYAPTHGRFKVYLIDEVHMLSGHSFNALLKTLEEPPPHVKFLLATTDPQKLPVTILSRCLQFNLKRMSIALIEGHLKFILQQESITYDETSIRLLSHGADGSMRDALSLLDQAIAFGGGKLEETEVQDMLGTVSRDRVMHILKALVANDAPQVMQHVAELSDLSADYASVLAELLAMLHQMALAQKVPDAVDENLVDREVLKQLAKQVSSEDIQLFYQIGLIGRRDLPLAPDPRSGLEMALLRMLAFKPTLEGRANAAATPAPAPIPASNQIADNRLAQQQATKTLLADSKIVTAAAQMPTASAQAPVSTSVSTPPVPAPTAPATSPSIVVSQFDGNWAALLEQLNLRGMVKQLAVNCTLREQSSNEIILTLNKENEQLLNPIMLKKLEEALCASLQQKLKLTIELGDQQIESPAKTTARNQVERQQNAEELIHQDPVVQALKENFNAEVVPNSVKPINEQ